VEENRERAARWRAMAKQQFDFFAEAPKYPEGFKYEAEIITPVYDHAGIGWHRDKATFDDIITLRESERRKRSSFASECYRAGLTSIHVR
jgi:hypothetical protein